jgi:glycine cleavage system H protein
MSVYRGCDIPPDLLYDVDRDVWVRPMPDGTITLGMTDAAQTRSGKVLHIHFKKPGRHLDAGQSTATIESAKWAGPFPTPVA